MIGAPLHEEDVAATIPSQREVVMAGPPESEGEEGTAAPEPLQRDWVAETQVIINLAVMGRRVLLSRPPSPKEVGVAQQLATTYPQRGRFARLPVDRQAKDKMVDPVRERIRTDPAFRQRRKRPTISEDTKVQKGRCNKCRDTGHSFLQCPYGIAPGNRAECFIQHISRVVCYFLFFS